MMTEGEITAEKKRLQKRRKELQRDWYQAEQFSKRTALWNIITLVDLQLSTLRELRDVVAHIRKLQEKRERGPLSLEDQVRMLQAKCEAGRRERAYRFFGVSIGKKEAVA